MVKVEGKRKSSSALNLCKCIYCPDNEFTCPIWPLASVEVEHFSPARVSEKVLFHLLRHPSVNQEVHFDPNNRLSPAHYLYTRNHPVDYFILLLQVFAYIPTLLKTFSKTKFCLTGTNICLNVYTTEDSTSKLNW